MTSNSNGASAPIIETRDVAKSFVAGGKRLTVFDRLSLSVEQGGFLSIVGPSGCGKSTLLKLISGLDAPDAGEILFRGAPVRGPAAGMIYVFQQYSKSILPWRTAIENIAFGLSSHTRLRGAAARERCRHYAALVGLEGYESHYPHQLSGGMQQRVVIARALICEPAVLLMDEPFSAVDALTRALLQELVLKVWSDLKLTVIFVTHDVEEAVFLSTNIVSLTRAPATIHENAVVALPCPRDQVSTRALPEFAALRQRLFASIYAQEKSLARAGGR